MTNEEIIRREAINNGIFTAEQCDEFLLNFELIPLHTFQMWKKLGFVVKKGQKARVTTKLWKLKKGKKKDDKAETVAIDEFHFYLANAYLFTQDQVEAI